jgi:hypothetical protein
MLKSKNVENVKNVKKYDQRRQKQNRLWTTTLNTVDAA